MVAFVPARNEAEIVSASVGALCAQGELLERVVAVDDASADGTGALLERLAASWPRLEVLVGRGPAPGECGKPAALAHAFERCPGAAPWLLFLDADVVLEPGAVAGLVALAEERGVELLTVIPRMELGSALERVVMPAIGALVLAWHPPERVADPGRPEAFANGQLILIRRALYERIGGHRAVAREVLEDVRLAGLAKAAGARLLVADGRGVAHTRMYASWGELAEGWSKNLFLLAGARLPRALGWALFTVLLGLSPLVALLVGGWPAGVAGYAAILAMQMTLRWRGGAPAPWAVLAPVGAAIAAGLLVASAWRHRRGGFVEWKGRRYGGG